MPKGVFRTGAIRLESNINLHISEGAVISFYSDCAKYPLVRSFFEGNECYNHSPFLYACGEINIAITGTGTIDGNGKLWWERYGHLPNPSAVLRQMAEEGVPVEQRAFGEGYNFRPNMVEFIECRNILIQGVTLLDSVMWMIHPVLCQNVTVSGVTITSHGPNSDGCDPECCRDVWVKRGADETSFENVTVNGANVKRLHMEAIY